MKTKLLFFILFVCCMACKDDNETPAVSSDIFMKATVGSQPLEIKGTGTPNDTRGTSTIYQTSDKTLYLTGNNGTTILSVSVTDFKKSTGSYTLGEVSTGKLGAYIDNTDTKNPITYYSKSGTLVITKYDGKTIEGTFSFTSYNATLKKEVVITNGQFKTLFTEI